MALNIIKTTVLLQKIREEAKIFRGITYLSYCSLFSCLIIIWFKLVKINTFDGMTLSILVLSHIFFGILFIVWTAHIGRKDSTKKQEEKISFDDMIYNLSSQGSVAQVINKGRELELYSYNNVSEISFFDINRLLSKTNNVFFAGIFFASIVKCIPDDFLSKNHSIIEKSLKVLKTDEMTFKVFLAGVANSRHPKLADEIQEILKEKTNVESR